MNAPDSTAATPQRTPYNVDDIPEVQMAQQEKPSENPLVPALETITRFVELQEQQGNPSAAEMKQHLAAFMQAAMKQGGAQPEQPQYKVEVPEEKAVEEESTGIQPLA